MTTNGECILKDEFVLQDLLQSLPSSFQEAIYKRIEKLLSESQKKILQIATVLESPFSRDLMLSMVQQLDAKGISTLDVDLSFLVANGIFSPFKETLSKEPHFIVKNSVTTVMNNNSLSILTAGILGSCDI